MDLEGPDGRIWLYSLLTVATDAGITRPTVTAWLANGRIRASHSVEGAVVFTAAEREAVIAEGAKLKAERKGREAGKRKRR